MNRAELLAVEDNPANLALLHAVLDREGYRLHDATTLLTARVLLRSQRFDLVLLDLRMPDGHGLELAREIRTHPETSALPIVVVSASVLPCDQAAAIQAGCNMFVTKPIVPATLVSAVAAVLRATQAAVEVTLEA
jgi:CheY-like chemotaxis protein